jgi:hypothetical protein
MSLKTKQEKFNRMHLAGSKHEVIRFVLLHHEPHAFDVIFGVAPVALGIEIAEVDFVLCACVDSGNGASDFAGHKRFSPTRRFMVKHDSIRGVHSVAITVIYCAPVSH